MKNSIFNNICVVLSFLLGLSGGIFIIIVSIQQNQLSETDTLLINGNFGYYHKRSNAQDLARIHLQDGSFYVIDTPLILVFPEEEFIEEINEGDPITLRIDNREKKADTPLKKILAHQILMVEAKDKIFLSLDQSKQILHENNMFGLGIGIIIILLSSVAPIILLYSYKKSQKLHISKELKKYEKK